MESNRPRSWIQKNYTSFNGIRGLAILMVFLNHYGALFTNAAWPNVLWTGVDLFFVLSGFLITGILFDSKSAPDFFRNFFMRRALRILPLYYGFFLAIAVLTPLLHLRYDPAMWSYLAYCGNFFEVNFKAHNPTVIYTSWHHFTIGFGYFWSLCVEEQFYLVWPLIIWLLPNRKAMMRFCIAAILSTVALRTLLYLHDPAKMVATNYLYYVTYARCDSLIVGAWFALWLRGVKLTPAKLRSVGRALIVICGGVLVVGQIAIRNRYGLTSPMPLLCTYGDTLIALVAAGILLLSLDESARLSRLFRARPLSKLGVISYGFYLFHGLFLIEFYRVRDLSPSPGFGLLIAATAFGLTFVLAWLSFRSYESPFLRLKDFLAPGHKSVPAGQEVA